MSFDGINAIEVSFSIFTSFPDISQRRIGKRSSSVFQAAQSSVHRSSQYFPAFQSCNSILYSMEEFPLVSFGVSFCINRNDSHAQSFNVLFQSECFGNVIGSCDTVGISDHKIMNLGVFLIFFSEKLYRFIHRFTVNIPSAYTLFSEYPDYIYFQPLLFLASLPANGFLRFQSVSLGYLPFTGNSDIYDSV